MPGSNTDTNGLLGIISSMITPAILILASGSLVASTLTRIARITDRARVLIERAELASAEGDNELAARLRFWLRSYRRRESNG